jgi:ABC-type branched-subunit amino acid transport system substrate-binding protein
MADQHQMRTCTASSSVLNNLSLLVSRNRPICQLIAALLSLGVTLNSATGNPRVGEEIVLGMSTALSGPAADLGQDMRRGVLAGFERANRAGGVNGRKLRLVALDDGYEPSRTAPSCAICSIKTTCSPFNAAGTPGR